MDAVVAIVIGVLILAAVLYDVGRLITLGEWRWPPLARLCGRRAALEATERWCAGLRRHGRIDTADYQRRMSLIAHGQRTAHQEATARRR
ncbi:hypothetical protein [Streptomyces sp. Rer75]|uniref:hypothetical protein n=1 Tax=Streptomyces sp. Rer75 TaxID=2750011 RepID=UPI0015CFFFF0|nr:hypothetical protein [Streptomyces sp. Rer75]QLH25299.1 hypothetical protein HYQ63_35520 [Streptomyces sp. Rer75]